MVRLDTPLAEAQEMIDEEHERCSCLGQSASQQSSAVPRAKTMTSELIRRALTLSAILSPPAVRAQHDLRMSTNGPCLAVFASITRSCSYFGGVDRIRQHGGAGDTSAPLESPERPTTFSATTQSTKLQEDDHIPRICRLDRFSSISRLELQLARHHVAAESRIEKLQSDQWAVSACPDRESMASSGIPSLWPTKQPSGEQGLPEHVL